MNIYLGIEITCLIYTLVVMLVYFSKKRAHNYATKMYTFLLVATVLGILLEMFNTICGMKLYDINTKLCRAAMNIAIAQIIVYNTLIFIYFLIQSLQSKRDNEEKYNKLKKIIVSGFAILAIVLIALIIFIPCSIIHNESWYYAEGFPLILIKAWIGLLIVYCIYAFISKFKTSTKKEKLTYISVFILEGLIVAFNFIAPYMMVTSSLLSFVTITLFFTLENPDANIINKLESANAVKQEFLSSMSHELKTPLNIILGLSNTPAKELGTLQSDMQNINVEALALSEIFSNIIDMNTLENGVSKVENKNYNIKEIITPLVNEYNKRLKSKGIELKCFCDSMIPQTLCGDPDKITNATRKLLSNAAKYTEKGTITMSISGEFQKNIYLLKIEVKDTGKGIEKDQFNKIFKEFGRSSTDVNSSTSGIGLGLTICKILVSNMGGKILVGSDPGVGSTFVLQIPQLIAGSITTEQALTNKESASSSGEAISGKSLKALIVDDNAMNLKVGKKILESFGLEVMEATSGEECLKVLNDGNKFNLIFMDIMMPEKDGVITMHEVRYLDLPYVPEIVALTADAAIGSKERYLKEGFDDYIPKPLTPDEVTRVLKKIKK